MLLFINSALGACPSKYVIAGPRNSSICRRACLECAEASMLDIYQRSARMGLCKKSS